MDVFRRVYLIDPKLLPKRAVNVLNHHQKESERYYGSDSIRKEPLKPMCIDGEPITIHLIGHCDGVQWFKNFESKRTAKPILSKIIGFSKSDGSKVQVCGAPVFVVGIFYGKGCPNTEVMKRTFAEWNDLNAKRKDRQNLPYYVQFDFWSCDAVQRMEFKGCASWAGYDGCERCISEGEWVGGVIVHELTTFPKRIDKKWATYKEKRLGGEKGDKERVSFLFLLLFLFISFYYFIFIP